MKKSSYGTTTRRKIVKILGRGAVLLPVAGLISCSGGSDDAAAPARPAASAPPQRPEPVQPEPVQTEPASAPAPAQSADLPRLSEDDPQAQSLSYVHDATTVDQASQPRYAPGQLCSNCALYTGDADAEWGGCSIFPGKAVKASGWCSVYAPKA